MVISKIPLYPKPLVKTLLTEACRFCGCRKYYNLGEWVERTDRASSRFCKACNNEWSPLVSARKTNR